MIIKRMCKCGCRIIFECNENSGQRYLNKKHIYLESLALEKAYLKNLCEQEKPRPQSLIEAMIIISYNWNAIFEIILKAIARLIGRFKEEKAS